MNPADDIRTPDGPAVASSATIWGPGSLDQLAAACESAGARRVMAVAGASAGTAARRLPQLLGKRYLDRWSDTAAHVPARQVSLAVGSARETHADGVLAIGGGSTIGMAKIVVLALRVPLIAVPTTFSGTEMTSRYIVTTEQGTEIGTSPRSLPRTVIYDPDLLTALPARVAAASGLTAIAHCVEALCYPGVPPLPGTGRARGCCCGTAWARSRQGRPALPACRTRWPVRAWPGAPTRRPAPGSCTCCATSPPRARSRIMGLPWRCCCRRCCAPTAPGPRRRARRWPSSVPGCRPPRRWRISPPLLVKSVYQF